jgi:hypothetical protein
MSVAIAIPEQAELSFKVEVSAKANITAPVARQNVDDLLLNDVGNLLYAGEPELFLSGDGLFWRVPVHYALPSQGDLGIVGTLAVDIQTGEVRWTFHELEQIKRHAESLYQRATSSAT